MKMMQQTGAKYARNTSQSLRISQGSAIPAGSNTLSILGHILVGSRSVTMRKENSTVVLPLGIDFTTDHDALLLDMRCAIVHLERAAAQLRS